MVSSCGYEKPCMSENRSWTLCMLGLTAFLTFMLAFCTSAVLNDTELPAAKQFQLAAAANDPIPATITQSGYSFVGTCEGMKRDDSGHGAAICDATQTVNNMCRDLLADEFPSPSGSSDRRLSALEGGEEEAEERALRAHGGAGGDASTKDVCYNSYVPWALVTFQAWDGNALSSFTRCSYRMGTRHNSHVLLFNETLAEVARLAAMPTLQIWNVSGRESVRCIVGYAPLAELDAFAEASGVRLPGVSALMTFFGAISACSILGCIYQILCTKDTGDGEDGEDGEGKRESKSEDYDELDDGAM